MRREARRFAVSELAVGVLLLALAAIILLDARRLGQGSIYGVGPAAAPVIVALGLAVLGIVTLVAAWLGRIDEAAAGTAARTDTLGVLVILAGLAALIGVTAAGGGFVIATTALFAATAWSFARRGVVLAVATGFALALVVYAVFTLALALSLPQGPIEPLVPAAYTAVVQWLGDIWQRLF
jgi:putative tricarboxylic transport membrane protein